MQIPRFRRIQDWIVVQLNQEVYKISFYLLGPWQMFSNSITAVFFFTAADAVLQYSGLNYVLYSFKSKKKNVNMDRTRLLAFKVGKRVPRSDLIHWAFPAVHKGGKMKKKMELSPKKKTWTPPAGLPLEEQEVR